MSVHIFKRLPRLSRREALQQGLCGLGVSAGLPLIFGRAAQSMAEDEKSGGVVNPERILVIVELDGGNDGLNTVVPYGDDAYYRHRPDIAIAAETCALSMIILGFTHPWQGLSACTKTVSSP